MDKFFAHIAEAQARSASADNLRTLDLREVQLSRVATKDKGKLFIFVEEWKTNKKREFGSRISIMSELANWTNHNFEAHRDPLLGLIAFLIRIAIHF